MQYRIVIQDLIYNYTIAKSLRLYIEYNNTQKRTIIINSKQFYPI
jgi:hypothetical protein